MQFLYSMAINSNIFVFRTKDANDEPVVAIMNFFGSIDEVNVKHEVRGLNVYIRLRKSCPLAWPRLLLASDKCSWIIQNMEAFPEEMEIYYDEQSQEQLGE